MRKQLWSKIILCLLLMGTALWVNNAVRAEEQTTNATIQFSGYTWEVRPAGSGGPGPNQWDPNNVWVDANGYLHLKLSYVNGQWRAAELYTTQRLGFGTYQWQLMSRVDQFDPNVVLGLFNYTRPDVGPDKTNEIDIEFARWGNAANPNLNYVVWPAVAGVPQTANTYNFTLNGDYTTHRFTWNTNQILFQSLHGHTDTNTNEFRRWSFAPAQPLQAIPQNPLPLHMNLWLFEGRPPINGQQVEIIISKFTYTPATSGTPTPTASPTPTPTFTPTPTATTMPGTIAAPSNLTAVTLSDLEINLAWTDNSTNESGFRIERCLGSSCQLFTTGANVRSYVSTGLAANTTYCYRVQAYVNTQNSAYSNSVCRTTGPVPPTTLTANRLLATEANLFWVETSTNESGFRLERCTGNACTNFVQITLLPANGIGYHDTGLSVGTTYRYRVAAYNANGNSRYSAIRTITTLAAAAAAQDEETVLESTSETAVQRWQQNQTPLVIDHSVACVNGTQPTQVTLQADTLTFPMHALDDEGQRYRVIISENTGFAAATDYLLYVTWQCADSVSPMRDSIGLLQSTPDSASSAEGATHLYLPLIANR
jgi:hypothetical protein